MGDGAALPVRRGVALLDPLDVQQAAEGGLGARLLELRAAGGWVGGDDEGGIRSGEKLGKSESQKVRRKKIY